VLGAFGLAADAPDDSLLESLVALDVETDPLGGGAAGNGDSSVIPAVREAADTLGGELTASLLSQRCSRGSARITGSPIHSKSEADKAKSSR
jgi:hypothetical protein